MGDLGDKRLFFSHLLLHSTQGWIPDGVEMWPQDEYIDPVKHLEINFRSEEPVAKLCLWTEFMYLFKFLSDVFTRMTSFSNGVSSKKVYLKPCQCFPKAEYRPFSVFPGLNWLSSKKPEKCNFLRHTADGASPLIVSMADLQ